MIVKRRRIHDYTVIDIATGRVLEDEWYWYDGPVALAGGNPAWDQVGFAFYNDDGNESTATIIGTINQDPTLNTDTTYHFRALIQETSGNGGNNKDIQIEYNHNSGGWNPIATTSNVIRSIASGNLTDEGATSQRIGSGTFLTDNTWQDSADGTIGNGKSPDFNGNDECETVSSFQIRSADVSGGDTIQIRCRNTDGTTTFWTWTQVPTITVASAPTNYDRTLTNAVTITDLQDRADIYTRGLSDVADIVDTISRQRFVFALITSQLSISDIQGKAVSLFRLLTNDVDMADALNRVVSAIRVNADTLGINETVARVIMAVRLLTESADTADELRRLKERTVFILDGIDAADQQKAFRILARVLVSTLDVSEVTHTERKWTKRLAENLEILDTLMRSIIGGAAVFDRSLTDGVSTVDEAHRLVMFTRALSNSADAFDTMARSAAYAILNADSITPYDTISVARFVLLSIVDQITINDTASLARVLDKKIAEGVDVSDDARYARQIVRRLVASINVEDVLSRSVGVIIARFLSDSVTTDDVIERVAAIVRAAVDTLGVIDGVVTTKSVSARLIDVLDINDAIFSSTPLIIAITLVDTISSLNDETLSNRLRQRLIADNIEPFARYSLGKNILYNSTFDSNILSWQALGTPAFAHSWSSYNGGSIKQELVSAPSGTCESVHVHLLTAFEKTSFWVADYVALPGNTLPARVEIYDQTGLGTIGFKNIVASGRDRFVTSSKPTGVFLICRLMFHSIGIKTQNVGDFSYFDNVYVYPKENEYLYDSLDRVAHNVREFLDSVELFDSMNRQIDMVRRFSNALGISDTVLRDVYSFGAVVGLIFAAVRAEGIEVSAERRNVLVKFIKQIIDVDIGGPKT